MALIKVGAAWTKENDKGQFLSVSFDKAAILTMPDRGGKIQGFLFLNTKKKDPNQPDWYVMCPDDKDEKRESSPTPLTFPK